MRRESVSPAAAHSSTYACGSRSTRCPGRTGEAASHATSRLFDKAKTADDRSWKLFTDVLQAQASEEQVRRINQLMAKYRKEMKQD